MALLRPTCVCLSVTLRPQRRQKPPGKFGGAAEAGAGGDGGGGFFEGREQGAGVEPERAK